MKITYCFLCLVFLCVGCRLITPRLIEDVIDGEEKVVEKVIEDIADTSQKV